MMVNGKHEKFDDPVIKTISELISHFKLDSRAVAVELNGEIPHRSEWENIVLKDSDKVELIKFVGGG